MVKLEDITPQMVLTGILPECPVTVIHVQRFGTEALELTFKDSSGQPRNRLLYREDEKSLAILSRDSPWTFDGDGALFRLVAEAHRIHLAHLFDPVLAVHTSLVEPLPHQITAVYEAMLPRQPLRFLLADDPGAGKTIMAGLLIKELMVRGDVHRCLVVCPGNLAEQWQDEMHQRFHLPFEILTNDKLESARTGNWFLENNLVIARLDKLSRDPDVQAKLQAAGAEWDLVVADEAHKMSASYFGSEAKYTKRYRLGELLSHRTRHFLLMTATPHNGKEEDFQLFMALLDPDRFEGKFREKAHTANITDIMRRMVKENLLTFEAKPLFPERFATTVRYRLSEPERQLYQSVTDYVRQEFNRAEALQNQGQKGTIGFALTILQRRLASSPEAILQSLRRRRERLEEKLVEFKRIQRLTPVPQPLLGTPILDKDEVDDLEDAPEEELQSVETQILDQATAARSVAELEGEIRTLKSLETTAQQVRRGETDKKWTELSRLLDIIFTSGAFHDSPQTQAEAYGKKPPVKASADQKLVIFTEHRDTLSYLRDRVSSRFGRSEAVVCIHGGLKRDERAQAQEAFKHDPQVRVLIATDAAGEGINLQRAHLMVNYDLPWNPNRIEQRFGRIHRIGQREVCHLWNLVAQDTREGEVYETLLSKLEECRSALGGQVFDVLGRVVFDGRPLKDLLIEAILYGEQPEVRAKLNRVVEQAFDRGQLQKLIEDRALAHDAMDASRVHNIRETMERAEARRLQPYYIESFFLEAFGRLGGKVHQRESRRYEITHVPARVRGRDTGPGVGPVLERYERIVFEKQRIQEVSKPLGAFVCPGHPLLDSTLDLTLREHRDLLRRGTVLVDDRDPGVKPRMLFFLEHSIQDAGVTKAGEPRAVSKQLLYVEMASPQEARHIHYAPYLDYRPLAQGEPPATDILQRPECAWLRQDLEKAAQSYAIAHVVPEHLKEVRERRLEHVAKTQAAVQDRLVKEISYWDRRAQDLAAQEESGRPNARLNSNEARKRAEALQVRLERRLHELKLEGQLAAAPPVVMGGLLVVPRGLLAKIGGKPIPDQEGVDTQAAAARAREIVMEVEKRLGFEPTDRETEKLGYDIESRVPGTGKLRFIEVKGRSANAQVLTVTKNEILYSLNRPDDFILAIVQFEGPNHTVHYVPRPFQKEPDFGVTSVNYDFPDLLARSVIPK